MATDYERLTGEPDPEYDADDVALAKSFLVQNAMELFPNAQRMPEALQEELIRRIDSDSIGIVRALQKSYEQREAVDAFFTGRESGERLVLDLGEKH